MPVKVCVGCARQLKLLQGLLEKVLPIRKPFQQGDERLSSGHKENKQQQFNKKERKKEREKKRKRERKKERRKEQERNEALNKSEHTHTQKCRGNKETEPFVPHA